MMPRYREPELMDDPSLGAEEHRQALRDLERCNIWSGGAAVVCRPIVRLCQADQQRTIRVLDIATGGGDIPIALEHKARQAGIKVDIQGCDISPTSVQYAGEKAQARNASVRFFVLDALKSEIPDDYDVIMCSLFTHHLDPEEVVLLLKKMAGAAGRMVLISDLMRSRANLLMVYLATRILSRSPIIHFDGPVSVRAAYNLSEMLELAGTAGLTKCKIESRFPCRFLLTWSKPSCRD